MRPLYVAALTALLIPLAGINACNESPTPESPLAAALGSMAVNLVGSAAEARAEMLLALPDSTDPTVNTRRAASCIAFTLVAQGAPFAVDAIQTNATDVGPLPDDPRSGGSVRPCLDKFGGVTGTGVDLGSAIVLNVGTVLEGIKDTVDSLDPSYAEGCVAKARWSGVLDFFSQAAEGVGPALADPERRGTFVWPRVVVTGLSDCAALPARPKPTP